MRRLLIVSCSGTKDHAAELLPALARYTGAYYQMIKGSKAPLPEIVILSALYGFISPEFLTYDYNHKMDEDRAGELLGDPRTVEQWESLVVGEFDEVFVCAGAQYRRVIEPLAYRSFANYCETGRTKVETVSGGIGFHRSQLKAWLSRGAS